MSTISTTITNGITLGTAGNYTSPLTITATGAVEASSGNAIYGPASQARAVVNQGAITAAGDGVHLSGGGYVGNAGGLIEGGDTGVYISGAAGTLTNSGTIIGSAGIGGDLAAGGTVVNSGTILSPGSSYAVEVSGTTGYLTNSQGGYIGSGGVGLLQGGTVVNYGRIEDTQGHGVRLGADGSVDNMPGGLIEGSINGVYIYGAASTVTNSATIVGTTGYGVYLNGGGSVGNTAGLIQGYGGVGITGAAATVTNSGIIIGTGTTGFGISLAAGGTVIDSGTISGGSGTAISFGGTGGNLLVLENGYNFTDVVVGSSSATNTVELAGSVGAAVTASYNGLGLTHFRDVLFGASGYETLKIANTAGTLPVTISGFTLFNEIVDLTAIGSDGTITNVDTVNNRVTVAGSSGTVTLQFDASDGTNLAAASDGATGTDLTPCYRRDTLILTEQGEVAVEELAIGDKVVTLAGAAQPIRWIGHRAYDRRLVAGNRAVLPIRIEAGVLGDGIPARDLFVSPEHALSIDGQLVPARLLVNGITIRQVESSEPLEYFHIELDSHGVIFADGAPAETFMDTNNRLVFHNAAEFAALYPDEQSESRELCAPRVEEDSTALTAIRTALLERAEMLGRVTRDPGLHLVADGNIVSTASRREGTYQFAVAAGTRRVTLVSRSAVPAEVYPSSLDGRSLGVPVERIVLGDAGLRVEIRHSCPALGDGFHDDEAAFRWSDGRGILPPGLLACFGGDIAIAVHLVPSALAYPCEPPTAAAEPDANDEPGAKRNATDGVSSMACRPLPRLRRSAR